MMAAPQTKRSRGFTLLEMILSISIFLLLMTAAFSLVGATSELMTEVSEVQNASAVRLRFMEVCRTAFESADYSSSLEFHYTDSSAKVNTYLSLVSTPSAFDFGVNLEDEIDRVVLAAEFLPDGFLRSRVYYMTAYDWEDALQSGFTEIRAPYVELIPRMSQLSWTFYNQRTEEWLPVLDGSFEPSLVKLKIRVVGDAVPLESAFYFIGGSSGGFPGGSPLRP
ncbi:MAG: type II secretion system protein [Verrucomicrobiales bacterium]|nr:type II secretion system protein [Verrucomicrobiales bacterium]